MLHASYDCVLNIERKELMLSRSLQDDLCTTKSDVAATLKLKARSQRCRGMCTTPLPVYGEHHLSAEGHSAHVPIAVMPLRTYTWQQHSSDTDTDSDTELILSTRRVELSALLSQMCLTVVS